ncbi:MAG TPA: PQQ-dependent sugar dehydrogenase [Jatrophihabitantaceae bacterium]|nr:PQQ-dependent sugar dehydrogenase [Jatrophihabitantaceae bacterium]
MPRTPRTLPFAAGAALLAAVLAACGSGAGAQSPDWRPQPSFAGEGPGVSISPLVPAPTRSGSGADTGGGSPSGPSTPAPSSSAASRQDPSVVAKHLRAPVGLTLLPDGTALVGERTTGRIVRVQPKPNQPVTLVRTLTGLSTTGGGGLLDLALSPFYSQDGLIYAYITTAADNRVVAFTLNGPVTPVVTGIPRGSTDNAGRIAFGANGDLYIGTGDAGHPADAARRSNLAGKVLRVSDIGKPVADNPWPHSSVYTTGHRDPSGLCIDPDAGGVFETEAGTPSDEVNLIAAGASYGWPSGGGAAAQRPLAVLPSTDRSPGGCAVLDGVLYVTSLDGHALLAARIGSRGSRIALGGFKRTLVNRYGRLRTVVAAPDGALWLTTSNRDGHGQPIPADERVLRIVPSSGGANSVS